MELTRNKTIAIILASVAVGSVVGSLITYTWLSATVRISNTAQIKSVGVSVFKNGECTIELTMIDWGFLEPGETKNSLAYLKSTSNVPINVTMVTESWIPANATTFIGCSWNAEGRQISPEGIIPVNFTLTVDKATKGLKSFSFTIAITGSG
jgi:hypothetical protein